VLTAYATRILAREIADRTVLAIEAQRAENEFIGVPCGIMDQFAIANGRAGNALLLDCETLDFDYVPIELGEYRLIIINSNKPRQLAGSNYQDRRSECEQALSFLQRTEPALKNLCQATNEMISDLPSTALRKRVFHVITENKRVEAAQKALLAGNLSQFGELLRSSHESLRDNYEVTGYELDALAEAANHFKGCLGARMTGAGFGGCLIAIVHSAAVSDFEKTLTDIYTRKTSLFPSFYACEIVDGVTELDIH
jgi:galactokinase